MSARILASLTIFLVGVGAASSATQRSVTASAGWIKAPADGVTEATAFATVQNGTMYDVYLVGAECEVAGVVELRQASTGGAPAAAKEVTIAAFDRLDMAPDGVQIYLGQLKRPLKAGETISLTLQLDSGGPLVVDAVVK